MNIKATKDLINNILVDCVDSEKAILQSVSRKQHKMCKGILNDLYILLNQVDNKLNIIKTMQELKGGGK